MALVLLAVGAYHSLARWGWTELMARGLAAIHLFDPTTTTAIRAEAAQP